MKPLGLSAVAADGPPADGTRPAGGCSSTSPQGLASPASRAGLLEVLGRSDPLIGDALQTILDRGDFIPSLPDEGPGGPPPGGAPAPIETDPAIVTELIGRSRGVHRRPEARHPDEVRIGAARLHPGGHPGAEADPVRSAEPSGDHGGDGGHVVAQRPAAGVAGREERGRHAHAVRPPQRHVGDGAGAPRRRRRDPPASGGGGLPARRRGRRLPGRAGDARGRAGGARRHPGLPRQVRHALRRRDRHHEAALERTPHHARARDPRQRQELRAGRRRAALRAGAAGGVRRRNRSCWSACGPCRTESRRPKRPSG